MKFDLIFELSTPRPFTPEKQRAVYENAIEQAVVAEEAGFNCVWCVEHHFLEEYSHASCPDLLLAAIARETSHLRLGFGIATCVNGYHNAIRLAEKGAFLDHLSNGRVEFGTGRSSTWNELGGLEATVDDTKNSWDEYVRAIPRMWLEERTRIDGVHVSMPERAVLPKPLQSPHPPMWVAVTAPGTEVEAAERGLGALITSMADIEKNRERFQRYREVIKTAQPVGAFVNNQVAAVTWMHCAEDDALARDGGEKLFNAFSYAAAQTLEISEVYPSNAYSMYGLLASTRADPYAPEESGKTQKDGFLFGSPSRLTQLVQAWRDVGADRMVMMVQALEVIPQSEVLESIRLFGREVIPNFLDETENKGIEHVAQVLAS